MEDDGPRHGPFEATPNTPGFCANARLSALSFKQDFVISIIYIEAA